MIGTSVDRIETKVDEIPSRTLHIICPGLRHAAGHDLAYTLGMAAAARKAGLAVLIHHPGQQDISSTDGESRAWPLPADPKGANLTTRVIRKTWETVRRTSYAAIFRSMQANDLAFAHTVGFREAFLLASTARNKRFALLQRFDHYDDVQAIAAFKTTAKLAARAGITLFTDSEDLATEFGRISGRELLTLPPPLPRQQPLPRTAKATFGFLGAARAQKGFMLLPDTIAAIQRQVPEADFLIQGYAHPDDTKGDAVDTVRRKLASMNRVRLIDTVTNDIQNAALLDQSSVILTPYDKHTYRRVTSRVFVEGLAAGAGVMTTTDTWMAHEASRFNLERAFPVDFSNAGDVGRAARAALASVGKPAPHTSAWLEEHSFDQLISKLLGALEG